MAGTKSHLESVVVDLADIHKGGTVASGTRHQYALKHVVGVGIVVFACEFQESVESKKVDTDVDHLCLFPCEIGIIDRGRFITAYERAATCAEDIVLDAHCG